MARNRIEAILEDSTIALVAELAARKGISFDEALELRILYTAPKTAPKPAAKTAAKSRK